MKSEFVRLYELFFFFWNNTWMYSGHRSCFTLNTSVSIINSKKVTMRRDLRTSSKAALGRYLTQINWPLLFTPLVSCEEKWQVFQEVIHSSLDTIMPVKSVKICTADVPWMNEFEISYEETKGVQRIWP